MPAKSYLFTRPPLWRSLHQGLKRPLSTELQSWLNETGSLTKRLRGIYGQDFGIQVLFHCWKPAFIDECLLLGLPPARYQLIREVILHAAGQPLILARTLLPEATIKIAHRNLSHLGNRPLGEVIFAYPDLKLDKRQFSRSELGDWSPELRSTIDTPETWGRRTIYTIQNQPLLVAEFFLPNLVGHVSSRTTPNQGKHSGY